MDGKVGQEKKFKRYYGYSVAGSAVALITDVTFPNKPKNIWMKDGELKWAKLPRRSAKQWNVYFALNPARFKVCKRLTYKELFTELL